MSRLTERALRALLHDLNTALGWSEGSGFLLNVLPSALVGSRRYLLVGPDGELLPDAAQTRATAAEIAFLIAGIRVGTWG
ncbi:MAG: hypothetical protein IT340_19875 [Chloroflexi bacterium]|nr:hypothetical protein [Chloroflexota bacterium]